MLDEKEKLLLEFIRKYKKAAVAFSGGVDSSVVLAACQKAGIEVYPLFAKTMAVPEFEKQDARNVARETGTVLTVLEHNPLQVKEFRENIPQRCYFCKKALLKLLKQKAASLGCSVLFDGTNLDDCGDYRPGMAAVKEEGIISPLLECRFTKPEVRKLAEKYGLSIAAKPAYACLASRIPYGEEITEAKLQQVEKAEAGVAALGFKNVRVRCHGSLARLELNQEQLEAALAVREKIVQAVKAAGFVFVTLDLEGYRTGSMNTLLKTDNCNS